MFWRVVQWFSESKPGEGNPGGIILLILYRLVVILGGITIWYQFHSEHVINKMANDAFLLINTSTDQLNDALNRSRQANIAAVLAPYLRCSNNVAVPTDEDVRQELLKELMNDGADHYNYLIDDVAIKCTKGPKSTSLGQQNQDNEVAFFRQLADTEVRYKIGLQNGATATAFQNAYDKLPETYKKFVDTNLAQKAGSALTKGSISEAIDSYVIAFRRLANGPDNIPPYPIDPSNSK